MLRKQISLRLSGLLRSKWRLLLLCISFVLFVLDQKRRSKLARRRFAELYENWIKSVAARESLKRWHSTITAKLANHDPSKLRARYNVGRADLAIAGGGFKSLYAMGAYFVLQHANIMPDRMSGASSGAYIAAVVAGNRYRPDDLLEENLLGWCDCCVRSIRECKAIFLGKIWEYMCEELVKRFDGWLPGPNMLFISVTTLGWSGMSENVVTNFQSAEELAETICASCAIPFILCDGPFKDWRGQCAIDGGFKNNAPVSVFGMSEDNTLLVQDDRIIVKADGNKIAGMPLWRIFLHVVYAPLDTCGSLMMEGVQDMLEALTTGKTEVNGITVIPPCKPMGKRDFSYQVLPGKEHIGRLMRGNSIF